MHVHLNSQETVVFESIPARVESFAESQRNSIALRCGRATVTYAELGDRMQQVGAVLRQCGCKIGDRVALIAENNVDFITAFMGIVRSGFCAVTLPTMLPPENVATMLDDSEATVLISSGHCRDLAFSVLSRTGEPSLQVFGLDFSDPQWPGLWGAGSGSASAAQSPPCNDPDAEFNIVYSSGTTGIPKGILHNHGTRATMAAGFEGLGFDSSAICLVSTPLYSNMSIPAFLSTLWGGGTVEIMKKFVAQAFLELASDVGATHFFIVPAQVARLFDVQGFEEFDLSAARLKYVAGAKLDVELKRRLLADWPGELVEVYGMSEGAPITMLFATEHPDKLDSVGRPPPGSLIEVIDDAGRLLPRGDTGEIVGHTGSMMLGYNNLPEETQALTWSHPETGVTYFRSGDIGRVDEDGYVYVVDRKKDVIISGGYNIYGSDLEAVFASHPAVAEVAVVGVESKRWGESPVAFIVTSKGVDIDEDELRDWANQRLGKFQRIAAVECRDELPRNALGKVVKRTLRSDYTALP